MEEITSNNEMVPIDSEQIEGLENYAPTELHNITIENVTQEDIVEAIKTCLKVSPLINPSKTLVNSVFSILKSLFIENKKYVILEAPTGSGKTIIGFMCFFCVQHLYYSKKYNTVVSERPEPLKQLTYFLTSAKMLQEQIDTDLDRFDFREFIFMLKGVANYKCIYETFRLSKPKNSVDLDDLTYSDRPCKGFTKKERQRMFPCDNVCPYQVARYEASEKSCTVLNYAYFLNIMRSFNPFFGTRFLTLADEAHLIPDIVCNIFNTEFNQFVVNQLNKLFQTIQMSYPENRKLYDAQKNLNLCFKLFSNPLQDIEDLKYYFDHLTHFKHLLKEFQSQPEIYGPELGNIGTNLERVDELLSKREWFFDLVDNRPLDLFFESEIVAEDRNYNTKVYKFIVRDLSEAEMVRSNFLVKLNKGIFMSATLGDIDEYAMMMGMKPDEYTGFRLPSLFDFSKSPVYLCKSGWLNYKNFEATIDKVIMDAIKICNEYHPNEKGIIHTSTFKICQLIKDKIELGLVPDRNRFLFYNNAKEKEEMVQLLKESNKPYIIVGPSLYEGLDLKDDQGRFNILVKVPYSALTDYTKKKIERFPFWYKRNTVEKIVQAIGRTNRHTNDYSTVYLLDSLFEKIIWDTNDSIVERITNKKIY
jgi:Rad3-related DNA helicase